MSLLVPATRGALVYGLPLVNHGDLSRLQRCLYNPDPEKMSWNMRICSAGNILSSMLPLIWRPLMILCQSHRVVASLRSPSSSTMVLFSLGDSIISIFLKLERPFQVTFYFLYCFFFSSRNIKCSLPSNRVFQLPLGPELRNKKAYLDCINHNYHNCDLI